MLSIKSLLERKFFSRSSLRARFARIYFKNKWSGGGAETRSGAGSTLEATGAIRSQLPKLLKELGVTSVLDVGCGDFNWMKEVQLPVAYMGVDIVSSVIEENKAKFETDDIAFSCLDATQDDLPAGYNFVLCREVLFHLSFADCSRVLRNVRSSNAKFLLLTTTADLDVNKDIVSGGFRNLNFEISPFNFSKPDYCLDDSGVSDSRVLALWRISELPDL